MTEQFSHDSAETWLKPQIRCPNCGLVVSGTRSSTEQVPMGTPTDTYLGLNGAPNAVATNRRPLVQREIYRVGPCGCQVSHVWREAYRKEIKRRRLGQPPQEIAPLHPQQLSNQVKLLEDRISKLMADLELAKQNFGYGNRMATERELIMVTDQLMRLVPGAHNKLPAVELSQWSKDWAKNNRYVLPPDPATAKALPPLDVLEKTMELHQQGLLSAETVVKAAGLNKTAIDEDMAIEILEKLQHTERADLDKRIDNMELALLTVDDTQFSGKYAAATGQYWKARMTYQAAKDNLEAKRTYAAILEAYMLTTGLGTAQVDYKKAGYTKQPINPSQVAVKVTSVNIAKFPMKVGETLKVGDTVYVPGMGAHTFGGWSDEGTGMASVSTMMKYGAVKSENMPHPNPNTGLQTKPAGPPPKKPSAATQYMNNQGQAADEALAVGTFDSWLTPKQKLVPPLAKTTSTPASNPGPEGVLTADPAGVSAAIIAANGNDAKALAQRVYKNILNHQSSGAALSGETKAYLKSYTEITGAPHPLLTNNEVPAPSTAVPVGVAKSVSIPQQAENLLDKLSSRNTRKIGRLKRKGTSKTEVDSESDSDSPEAE